MLAILLMIFLAHDMTGDKSFEYEWRCYALSASKAIFGARTYRTSYLPPGHDSLLFFDKWHWIVHMPSRTDTAGHIPRSLIA